MRNGAVNLINIESITESVVEDAASELISRVLDVVFSNIGTILLIIMALLLVFVLFSLGGKRKLEKGRLKEVRQLFKEKDLELDRMMLSDVFKDLERGLIQGNTKDILTRLEQRLLASHQYSEQLQRKLDNQSIPLFAMTELQHQMNELQEEVYAFAEQVDQYTNELTGINNASKQTAGLVQPVQHKYAEVIDIIERIADQYSYSLDELKTSQERVEAIVGKAAQSGSFDAVRAQVDAREAHQAVDYLHGRAVKLEKDIQLFEQMKQKLQERVENLRQQIANESDSTQRTALEEVIRQLDHKMHKLEQSLQSGAEVNLRSEAVDIEQIISDLG